MSELADVGAKHTREYLLEAVVRPNAKIAAGFDSVVLTRKSGGTLSGILARETSDTITLRQPNGTTSDVTKSDIAKRDSAPSGCRKSTARCSPNRSCATWWNIWRV
jgi:quinoprotein glucose dehydrogenase